MLTGTATGRMRRSRWPGEHVGGPITVSVPSQDSPKPGGNGLIERTGMSRLPSRTAKGEALVRAGRKVTNGGAGAARHYLSMSGPRARRVPGPMLSSSGSGLRRRRVRQQLGAGAGHVGIGCLGARHHGEAALLDCPASGPLRQI